MVNTYNIDNNTDNSDWIQTVRRLNEFSDFRKTYLRTGQKPPKGKELYQGPRGGHFYLANEDDKSEVEFMIDNNLISELRDSVLSNWYPVINRVASSIPDWITRDLRIHISTNLYLESRKMSEATITGRYLGKDDIIMINPLLLVISDEDELRIKSVDYNNEIRSSAFICVLTHELGHRVERILYDHRPRLVSDLFVEYENTPGAVTRYGKTNKNERFAEAFLYYNQNPRILAGRDPTSYKFMRMHVFDNRDIDNPVLKSADTGDIPLGSAWIEDRGASLKFFEKVIRGKKISESKRDKSKDNKSANPPFITIEPDQGLMQKSKIYSEMGEDSTKTTDGPRGQPQEDPLENPEYGYGNAVGSMSIDKSEGLDSVKKKIRGITHGDADVKSKQDYPSRGE
jgi:hypothetical protein